MTDRPLRDPDLLRDWGEPEASWLAALVGERRAAGLPVEDYITANPYDFGFRFSPELLSKIFATATVDSARYGADPLGRLASREAVAAWYGSRVDPSQILITPGTSMAYFYLFRLLAGNHGEVLCPVPTYPLFDDLARIAGLAVRRYHLQRTVTGEGVTRWIADPRELEFQITPRTRAIVVVSPHNPTGTVTRAQEMTALCEVANRAGIPVIMDEVFRTYTRDPQQTVPRPAECGAAVSFTLNGLSKSHYLPGLKLGWLVAEGTDSDRIRRMMHALEYMSDSFLPVSELTQTALPQLLGEAGRVEAERLADLQRARLDYRIENSWFGMSADLPEAGPYLCVPVTDSMGQSEDAVVTDLLENKGCLFHPGGLYGLPGYLVGTVYNSA